MAARSGVGFWIFFGFVLVAHFIIHLALGLGARAPDLLTVALLLAVRRTRASVAAGLGLVLGLLHDALASVAFGADALVLTLLGYLGARSRDLFEGDSLLFIGFYLFMGKWLHDLLYGLLVRELARGDLVSQAFVQAPLAALWAALAGIVAMLIYRAASGDR